MTSTERPHGTAAELDKEFTAMLLQSPAEGGWSYVSTLSPRGIAPHAKGWVRP
jgi:hypothetical protein